MAWSPRALMGSRRSLPRPWGVGFECDSRGVRVGTLESNELKRFRAGVDTPSLIIIVDVVSRQHL